MPPTESPGPESRVTANLFLIEDHPMLRDGFKQFVAWRGDVELVGEASSGAEALKQLESLTPDLLVLDVHLPDMNGLQLAEQLLQKQPDLKILLFSGDNNRSLVEQALKSGVRGYVLKTSALEELSQAFAAILAGKLYFSPEVCSAVLEDYRKVLTQTTAAADPGLSDQEVQVLRLVAKGARNKEIAADLGLSVKSIETYRSRLMNKLSCGSTAELICYAIRKGLVVP